MAGEQRGSGLSARSAAGPAGPGRRAPADPPRSTVARAPRPAGAPAAPRQALPRTAEPRPASPRPTAPRQAVPSPFPPAPVRAPAAAPPPPPAPARRAAPTPPASPSRIAVPDSRVVYVSVVEAARRTGASLSAIRGWAREGQVRSRTGVGPRGERVEVAVADVERLTAERPVAPPRRAPRNRAEVAVQVRRDDDEDDDAPADAEPAPGGQLVPLATVEAMERLSGELYLAGQRAARAEAVAELRDRRLADLQQEVDDLQREATGLWEQNQELLRRVAVAEAQVLALQQQQASGGGTGEQPRWRLRR